MIAYLEPFQFFGTLVMGIGFGILAARTYDQVRYQLRMRRIRTKVTAFAAAYDPATMDADQMMHHRALGYHPRDERCESIACSPVFEPVFPQTSGPEVAPRVGKVAGTDAEAVHAPGRTTAPDEPDGLAPVPPARSHSGLLHGQASDFGWPA